MEKNTTTFETGATSAAVNELILYTDNSPALAKRRDQVYQQYLPGNARTKHLINPEKSLKYEIINVLLYRAMNLYLDEFPDYEDNKLIKEMTVSEQDEYAQIYANRFADWKREKELQAKQK